MSEAEDVIPLLTITTFVDFRVAEHTAHPGLGQHSSKGAVDEQCMVQHSFSSSTLASIRLDVSKPSANEI
jgi:hypothetical protein